MNAEELKGIISECCNDVAFSYNGKASGMTVEVHGHVPKFQVWHGDETKEYDNVDDVMSDTFYSGKSLNELAELVEINII